MTLSRETLAADRQLYQNIIDGINLVEAHMELINAEPAIKYVDNGSTNTLQVTQHEDVTKARALLRKICTTWDDEMSSISAHFGYASAYWVSETHPRWRIQLKMPICDFPSSLFPSELCHWEEHTQERVQTTVSLACPTR